MKEDSKTSMHRREFVVAGLTGAAVLPVALFAAKPARAEELITDIPANAAMVSALQYVAKSPKPDQHCGNCQLYTAGEGNTGKCQLFAQGVVAKDGWCMSWAQKPA
ncbi:MAG: high-potential iron-sulfur protein [Myxococcota bacterium]|jgi:hypothetical protein|nr:high-potential iron-sulfur protein [Myxococcota bacterium]MDP6244216.1 high-potential iron-sulfur protein [Myxococcota bacterium]MDP7073504.1 high-potential iron-sulfur protein [Myxococcota bacterium]MDP7300660.1 high-potential iron-sulfur protein [Myxococcota bacterium]MDP7431760.1 high-potential iron-sulfur protein [Myxococcota bacterium]